MVTDAAAAAGRPPAPAAAAGARPTTAAAAPPPTAEVAGPPPTVAAAGTPPTAAEAAAPRYAVLGLGNLIQGDEALGGHVVDLLRGDPAHLAGLPDPTLVELVDGGTVGLGLVPYLVGLDGLVVVDVIDAGAEPGAVLDLDGADVMAHEPVMGVHDLGAEELLGALLFMDALPRRVRVLGAQPAAIALGTELSEPVAAAVPRLLELLAGHLAAWQAEDAVIAG